MSSRESARKKWTQVETLMLLHCYEARKDEFKNSRKKRRAYERVLEDMYAQGFVDKSVTVKNLEAKIRTLLIAYKSAKDNNRQTGAGRSEAPFMDQLDDIFGREPIIHNTHTLNLGGKTQMPLPENNYSDPNVGEICTPNEEIIDGFYPMGAEHAETLEPTEIASSSTSRPRKRKPTKEKYYEAKLDFKKKFYEDIKGIIENKCKSMENIEQQKLTLLSDALKKN